jgi:cytochrome c peroxidase
MISRSWKHFDTGYANSAASRVEMSCSMSYGSVAGPYFHDGSMQTLWDVMDHYNKGDGITNPWLDKDIQPLAMTEPEIDDVVAFLAALTSPQYKDAQECARQLAQSKVGRPQADCR